MLRKPYLNLSRQGKYKRRQSSMMKINQLKINQKSSDCAVIEENTRSEYHQPISIDRTESRDLIECESDDIPLNMSEILISDYDNVFSDSSGDEEKEGNFLNARSELESLKVDLKAWANDYLISHVAVTALLKNLQIHKCFHGLPSDSRTLLGTPRTVSLIPVEPGHYVHIGLQNSLEKIWHIIKTQSHIDLLINVDGLSPFKSSCDEIWPILGSISNMPSLKSWVFPIGIYCGKGKPSSCEEFLKFFVEEAEQIIGQGLTINNKTLSVCIKGFVCDTPAKTFILNVKGHTGYYSCTKCQQPGAWMQHRMTFPENDASLRTHESFLRQEDDEFHHGETPLMRLSGVNFIRSFPLDYLHLVCLGVMRSLLYIWILGPVPIKLPSSVVNAISNQLNQMKKHIPIEFSRKPRSLIHIKRWKATEYRQFLLYTGPVILKKILEREYKPLYEHFLALSISISILISPIHCTRINCDYANSLLRHFVDSTKILYGPQYIGHNLHGLTHLVQTVEDFTCLDASSTFPFENYLQLFKSIIRKGEKLLPQLVKRLAEIMSSNSFLPSSKNIDHNSPEFSNGHNYGPVLATSDSSKQYSRIKFPMFQIKLLHPDSCGLLKNGSIVVVENIVFSNHLQKMVALCKEFLDKMDFYEYPYINSSELNVFLVSNLSDQLQEKPVDEIFGKMILLPFKGKQVAMQLLHCL